MLAGLRQNLNHNVIGDHVAFDELADEVEVRLARGREANFDLLVAHVYEQFEHPQFAGWGHRINQRLIAIAQINCTPARCLGDHLRRPRAIRERDRREGGVALPRHG